MKLGFFAVLLLTFFAACSDNEPGHSGNGKSGGTPNAGSSGAGTAGSTSGSGGGSSGAGGSSNGGASGSGSSGDGGAAGDPGDDGGAGGDGTSGDGGDPGSGGTSGSAGGPAGAGGRAGGGNGGSNAGSGGNAGVGGNANGGGGNVGGGGGNVGDCTVYASPTGRTGALGTIDEPVRELGEAATIAAGQPVPGTVCACTNGGFSDYYSGDFVIPEGVSVLGSFACANWIQDSSRYRTRLIGVANFAAGASRATRFGAFSAIAVQIVNASPTVFDLRDTSVSVVGEYTGERIRPLIRDVDYTGTSAAVGVFSAAPEIVNVTGYTYSNAVRGEASVSAFGASGNLDGMIVRNSSFTASPPGGYATGVVIGANIGGTHGECSGTVTLDGVSLSAEHGVFTSAIGLLATGVACNVRVIGSPTSGIVGCGAGQNCTGIECRAPCEIENAHVVGAGTAQGTSAATAITCGGCTSISDSEIIGCNQTGSINASGSCTGLDGSADEVTNNSIQGAISWSANAEYATARGVRLSGGGRFVKNRIWPADALSGVGVAVEGTGTSGSVLDGNEIFAGACNGGGVTLIDLYDSNPLFTNNIISDRPSGTGCVGAGVVFLASLASHTDDAGGPSFVNNTFLYTRTASNARYGVEFTDPRPTNHAAKAVFVNNVFANLATVPQGIGFTFREVSTSTDPLTFSHNLVHDVGTSTRAGEFIYENEGMSATPITTIAALNALFGGASAANRSGNPSLDSSGHLLANSTCIDAGQSAGAPGTDIDGDARPRGAGIDIGADEAQ